MYDAYIEKEDLFGKTGEMKVIYTPRVSSAGNIVSRHTICFAAHQRPDRKFILLPIHPGKTVIN